MSRSFFRALLPSSFGHSPSVNTTIKTATPGRQIETLLSSLQDYLPFPTRLSVSLTVALAVITFILPHFRSYLSTSRRPASHALPSYFYPALTTHGRHLPLTAKNAFSYSLLCMAVDIDSLTSSSLDLPFRVFTHGGHPSTKLIGLRSRPYLLPGDGSLREKLETLLETDGIPREKIGKTWFITLPSLLGLEGQNPLSTFYVYARESDETVIGDLLCVILEVHNVFEESHCYILKPGAKIQHEPAQGYDLAFTFPRSFHVSPFNSRDSHYRVDLTNPFPKSFDLKTSIPSFKTHVRLLTPDGGTKFNAVLTSGSLPVPLEPWSTFSVLKLLARRPLSLLLVQTITNYQAFKLHYRKRLALYVRPETITQTDESIYNPPEKDDEGVGKGLQRGQMGWVESNAKQFIQRWARRRAEELGVDLLVNHRHTRDTFSTANPKGEAEYENDASEGANGKKGRNTLVISTSDSLFYTNLIVAPSPQHLIVIAPEKLTSISSPSLFTEFFDAPNSPVSGSIVSLANRWRNKWFTRLYANSTLAPPPSIPPLIGTPHFTSSSSVSSWERWMICRITFWYVTSEMMQEDAFNLLRARFVPGQEPWKVWERGLKRRNGIDTIHGERMGTVLLDEDRREIVYL